MNEGYSFSDCFYGTVTVGERGQIVIPSEARKKNSINHGDKLIFVQHPMKNCMVLFKVDELKDFIDYISKDIEQFKSKLLEHSDSEEDK